ncbi:MAG TPA: penicillin-binding protein activator LpoB [Cyclobacteriaceae bacterium]
MNKVKLIFLSLILLMLFTDCARRSVTRVNPNERIDLSGRWNDTDSKLVAEEMITDALGRKWRNDFIRNNQGDPTVIVGIIQNKTSEHIEPETFIKDIEREFINSDMVKVVQNSVLREKLREERADQAEFASPETQARWGRELGADYMMFGLITSITDSYRNEKVVNYKVNLELVDIETNEKVWIGDKEIKKYIKN